MSRVAKIAGWAAFVLSVAGLGLIAWGVLSVRSSLADGSLAPGPEPIAYVVVAGVVLMGSTVAGLLVAAITEAVVRLVRRARR